MAGQRGAAACLPAGPPLASLRAPQSTARKYRQGPPPTTGPSAIEIVVVRRSTKVAYIGGTHPRRPPHRRRLVALHNELDELTERRRPEVISRIKSARELGDLSENADYEAARKEQSFLEGRVQQLEQMIKSAVIIEHRGNRHGGRPRFDRRDRDGSSRRGDIHDSRVGRSRCGGREDQLHVTDRPCPDGSTGGRNRARGRAGRNARIHGDEVR